jgi:hypothetical protein
MRYNRAELTAYYSTLVWFAAEAALGALLVFAIARQSDHPDAP